MDVSITLYSAGDYRGRFRASGPKDAQSVHVGQRCDMLYSMSGDGSWDEMEYMTGDSAAASERRGSQRFKISAPLTVLVQEHEIPAYTRDLSNRGVYFYIALADSAYIDRDFEFLIEMPSEITLSSSCRIRCQGRLVRKEMTSRNLTGGGIAAEILNYSILRGPVGTD
jgi:hypothetical protein